MSNSPQDRLHRLRSTNFSLDDRMKVNIIQEAHRLNRRRKTSIAAVAGSTLAAVGMAVSTSFLATPATADELRPMPTYVELDESGSIDLGLMHSLFSSNTSMEEIAERFSRDMLGLNVVKTERFSDSAAGMDAIAVTTQNMSLRVDIAGDPDSNSEPSPNPFGPWISTVVNQELANYNNDFAFPSPLLLGTPQDMAEQQKSQELLVNVPQLPCDSAVKVELKTWDSEGAHVVGTAVQARGPEPDPRYQLPIPYNIPTSTWAFAVVSCQAGDQGEFMFAQPVALLAPNTVLESVRLNVAGRHINLKAQDLYSYTSTPWMFQRTFMTVSGDWIQTPSSYAPIDFRVRSGLGQLSPESYCRFLEKSPSHSTRIQLHDPRFRCGVVEEDMATLMFEFRPGLTLEIDNIWVVDADWKLSQKDWEYLASTIQLTEE